MTVEMVKAKIDVCLNEINLQGSCSIANIKALLETCEELPEEVLENAPLMQRALHTLAKLEFSDEQILTQLVEWVVEDFSNMYERPD